MRVLVVFYSLTGTTDRVARALATALDADREQIRCAAYHRGFLGFCRAGMASWRNRIPGIAPRAHDPSAYDLVLVGGPVWAWNACTPVRAYLRAEAAHLPAVAFFVTAGGVGFAPALTTMAALAGRKPVATLALRTEDVRQGKDRSAIAAFVDSLRRAQPASAPANQP